MALSISGIGSGLDINSIVSALVSAERQPITNRINANLERQTVQISSMGAVKSALADFQTTLKEISESVELVGQKMNIPADAEGFEFTQVGRSAPGNYTVETVSVADRQKNIMVNGVVPGTDLGTGTLRVTNGKGDSVDIPVTTGSLEGVAKAINSQSDATGVSARVMVVKDAQGNDVEKLVYESVDTGESNSFGVEVVSGNQGQGQGSQSALSVVETANMKTLSSAQDAEIKIDGERFTSSTNSFEGAIKGVNIQVDSASIGSMITMSIASSNPPIKDKLSAFIDAYNKMVGVIKSKSDPGTEGNRNPLESNAMVSQIKNQIRSVITKTATIDGKPVTLAQMGVMTNAKTGDLELNSAQMESFLKDNSSAVQAFFSEDASGLFDRVEATFKPFIQTGGMIDTSNNSAQSAISRLNKELDNHEDRMSRFENSLFEKYSKMDSLMATLNSQNNAITAMLSSMGTYS